LVQNVICLFLQKEDGAALFATVCPVDLPVALLARLPPLRHALWKEIVSPAGSRGTSLGWLLYLREITELYARCHCMWCSDTQISVQY
jgi:hypothetical protein